MNRVSPHRVAFTSLSTPMYRSSGNPSGDSHSKRITANFALPWFSASFVSGFVSSARVMVDSSKIVRTTPIISFIFICFFQTSRSFFYNQKI